MLTELEQEHLDELRRAVRAKVTHLAAAPWTERRVAAAQLLKEITDAWWRVHVLDPTAYQRDLENVNRRARWKGDFAQLSKWHASRGQHFLYPFTGYMATIIYDPM